MTVSSQKCNGVKSPLKAFTPPDCRFDSIHVDIVRPLPPSKCYTYLFTCIDRYTHWPEAIPMVDATAESCASALLTAWISRFCVLTTISSDQGQQFESDLWHSVMNLLGATRLCITAYHPQANGLWAKTLRARGKNKHMAWDPDPYAQRDLVHYMSPYTPYLSGKLYRFHNSPALPQADHPISVSTCK